MGHSRISHPSSSCLFFHREFSGDSKYKDTTSRTGKVCKDFGTQDLSGNPLSRKQLYRSAFQGHDHVRRYLPGYAPRQEWRFSSSWENKSKTPCSIGNNNEAEEEKDWYSRWEKQRLKQYNDFMKKVEDDPYTALFGKSWLNFGGENPKPRAAGTSARGSPIHSVPKDEKSRESTPSKPKPSSTEVPVDRGSFGRQSKTMPIQEHGQQYQIDPITNRKVFKVAASSGSTLGNTNPQVKDEERVFESFSKRWDMVSPTPLDHRSVVVEHEQVFSSSNSPSKGTLPIKSQKKKEWLTQEGFGGFQEAKANTPPTCQVPDAKPNTMARKIESALDRHLNSKSTSERENNDRPKLQYKPIENETEDLDLLRPSDVRASAGLRGNPPKETDFDKQARRKKLEEKYESCSPDHGEAASNKPVQKREDLPVREDTATEPRFGSWLRETLQAAEPKTKEASKSTSTTLGKEISDTKDFNPESINLKSDSIRHSKNEISSDPKAAIASVAKAKVSEKAEKLKAQIVPFKAKLDAMKADYDSLRQEWLQEIRNSKARAAKTEEDMKARKIAQGARDLHEEEVKAQKLAMEAMEIRSSDTITKTAKTASAGGSGSNDAKQPAPRRLQSFYQGEGDMASNVHEFAGRDRWYKRKAPHAMNAKDAENDAKLQKATSDRALIREIRAIYEDTYGTIDTKHRQPHILSTPSAGISSQPINPPSGEVDPQSSKERDKSQISDALMIIQKLFVQLREAQSMIKNQTLDNTTGTKVPIAFEKNVMHIMRTLLRLARVRRGHMISRDPVEATAATANSKETTDINAPSTTAPNPTYHEVRKATNLNTYCVLAYDSATESVKSFETRVPLSEEESLLPLDALNRLSNPAKFVAHAISLGAKGYKPVSGTTNILVFRKEVTPQDLAEVKETGAKKEPNPIRDSLDHLHVATRGSFDSSSPFDITGQEDIDGCHHARLRGIKAEQQTVKGAQKQAVEKIEKEDQKAEKLCQTVTDCIAKEEQPPQEAQTQELASSASPSPTSSDRVHRQEMVFSGSRQGKWVEHNANSRRCKRAAERRRKTMKGMLTTGAFTAACCYCVGVASELMHS